MKIKNLILLNFLAISICYGQYSVIGDVIGKTGEPIGYAEVLLQTLDSIPLKSKLADENGFFAITDIKSGMYKLDIKYFSEKIHSQIINVKDDLKLHVITENDAISLEEVVVSTQKTLFKRKMDRTIFNVDNFISVSNGDAIRALKVTPSVLVKSNGIALVGKNNVSVMVNDKIIKLSGDDLINYLHTISGDDIKSIEVITTPPAKYEAEGDGGLINIVLKKGVKNSWRNTVRSSYIQTTYPAFSFGNSFVYDKNNLSISLSADYKKGNKLNLLNYEIFFSDAKNVSRYNSKKTLDYHSGRLEIDYKLSEKTLIGGVVMCNKSIPNSIDSSLIYIINNYGHNFSNIFTRGNSKQKNINSSYNVYFSQNLDTLGRKMLMDLDYFKYTNERNREFETKKYLGGEVDQKRVINNGASQKIENYSVKFDFEYPTKWIDVFCGYNISFTRTTSNLNYTEYNSKKLVLDNFYYRENIQSLYFDFAKKITKKTQVKLGLRFENTQIKASSVILNKDNNQKYIKLFPTWYILYSINNDNFISINYGKRIGRPKFSELNPFKWYINTNSFSGGNPFLKPSFTHNIEVTYGYKKRFYSILINQFKENGFGQIPNVNSDKNQQVFTRENYYKMYVLGLSEVYIVKPLKWWKSINQSSLFFSNTIVHKEYKNRMSVQNGLRFKVSTQNTFNLSSDRTIKGEVNFLYNLPYSGQIYKSSESSSLDLAINFLLLDKMLSASFMVNDLLKSSDSKIETYTDGIKQIYNKYNDNRFFSVSLKYFFGNKKITKQEKKFGNEKQKKRAD